jgi:hypothetical protein
LHQAVEAKENVDVKAESITMATITFQNYFRMYKKLSGMTGTAATEANEFLDIYNLQVIEIPTNIKVSRIDEDDEIYKTAEEKYEAILKEMTKGLDLGNKGFIEIDRKSAIDLAVKNAQSGDVVLLMGKGHESGQEVNAVVTPFDDRVELAESIKRLAR